MLRDIWGVREMGRFCGEVHLLRDIWGVREMGRVCGEVHLLRDIWGVREMGRFCGEVHLLQNLNRVESIIIIIICRNSHSLVINVSGDADGL